MISVLWRVEEMRNLDQVQQPIEKSLQLMHVTRICTRANKQQTLKGLKKIANDKQ
jgi:hypothetical protein